MRIKLGECVEDVICQKCTRQTKSPEGVSLGVEVESFRWTVKYGLPRKT